MTVIVQATCVGHIAEWHVVIHGLPFRSVLKYHFQPFRNCPAEATVTFCIATHRGENWFHEWKMAVLR